jgi:antitoxin component HigA of HigAB toxin-antitoxin module
MLRFMMEQHGHKQKELGFVMSRSVDSEVLNGHRKLIVEQMRGLGKFYNMDPSLFWGAN